MRSAVLLPLLGLLACSPTSETTAASQTTTPEAVVAKTSRPAIATLQTHDKKVTILGGMKDGDVRVTVKNLDGTIVADGITADELSHSDPILGALIQSAVASNGGSSYLDATLYLDTR